ncbi:MAG: glutathione S-transferase family protein, partial [Candidatus Binatia bacterium]|nr:glutathione S-transferase family protein [Candidatus Binatia bacterium]
TKHLGAPVHPWEENGMREIRLYGYSTSPFVRKVGCCLYFKQLPFEFVPVDPTNPEQIAFTRQTQVPVLQIGNEWRTDSTPLALWLDELFPERPLFGQNSRERDLILGMDKWVTDSLILSSFRSAHEGELTTRFRQTAWRLAAIVSSQTPLSDEIRNVWPEMLKMAPFIKHMMCDIDRTEPLPRMRQRVAMELLGHLGEGPFFGGLDQPSLVDLAIYPQLVFSFMVGIEQNLMPAEVPALHHWLDNIRAYLPDNPLLVPDFMIVSPLPPVKTEQTLPPQVANG